MILMKGVCFKGRGEAVFCAAGRPGKGVDESVLAQWLEQTCIRSGCLVDQNAKIYGVQCMVCIIFRSVLKSP